MGACQSNTEHNENKEAKHDNHDNKLKLLEDITKAGTVPQTYDFNICKVISVYDGDTITIAAWHNGKICRFPVRLYGIDCDEMKGGTEKTRQNAKLAKQFVMAMCLNKIVHIDVLNGKLKTSSRPNSTARFVEKYGRLLANITLEDGRMLNNSLIELGLARPYFGGKKSEEALEPKWNPTVNLEEEGEPEDSLIEK